MSYKLLTVEKELNGITLVGINNPPANTLNDVIQNDFRTLIKDINTCEQTRVALFYSQNPKIFMGGAELKQVAASDENIDLEDGIKEMQDIFNAIETLKVPTLAAIDGYTFGGGMEFVLACDLRIMGKGQIGLTEVSLGLIPGAGGTQRLPRLIGKSKALEMILFSSRIDAEEAERIGAISKAVEPGKAYEEAYKLAQKLVAGPRKTQALAKKAVLAADFSLEEGLRIERKAFMEVIEGDEMKEGVAAFMEKRQPNFS